MSKMKTDFSESWSEFHLRQDNLDRKEVLYPLTKKVNCCDSVQEHFIDLMFISSNGLGSTL
jgi:hypothetical protein